MRKHAETFHAIKGCKLYINFATFKIETCGTIFKRYLHENKALHSPCFSYENESL